MKKYVIVCALSVVALVGGLGRQSRAAIGVDILGGGSDVINPPYTLGWGFTLPQPIQVTALGMWDEDGDGLVESHDVGLWRTDGTLLSSTSVSNASPITQGSVSGLGRWRFTPVTPVTLQPGSYIVAGVSGNDAFRTFVPNISLTSPLTNHDSGKFASGPFLQFPTQDEASDFSLFGANLLFTAVPEPSSFLLVGIAAAGLMSRGRYRRNRAVVRRIAADVS
jgi:Domain of unknown function (DUF4082)/PEP-CTERM motif